MTVDFNDYFWGEKNNGFDVLYHNMKFGLVASKELSEFLREKSNIEEQNSKMMSKLAHKASTGTLNSTFAPVWTILRTSAEKLSTLHMQMVQKLTELVKDVAKYADELHKKHKCVKEEESQTLECVQAIQTSTVAVQKLRDLYASKVVELEKLRKDNGSHKDAEKLESKLKKLQEDYKALLDKHNPIKNEFERRMSQTCKRFQEIEEVHLRQMKEFLSTYLEMLQNNHDMVGQVHSDFKRQFVDMSVDKLLEQFVLNKYTGLEKPEMLELEFVSLSSGARLQPTQQASNSNSAASIQAALRSGGAAAAASGSLVSMDQRGGGGGGSGSAGDALAGVSLGSGSAASGSIPYADDAMLGGGGVPSPPRPTSPETLGAQPPPTSASTSTVKSLRSWFMPTASKQQQQQQNVGVASPGNFGMPANSNSSNNNNYSNTNITTATSDNLNTNNTTTTTTTGTINFTTNVTTKNSPNSELLDTSNQDQQQQQQQHPEQQQPHEALTPTASVAGRKQMNATTSEQHLSKSLNEQDHLNHQPPQQQQTAVGNNGATTTTTATTSRRTTSLLNIFTSNSQVSGILRSRRDKAKTKKSKKKKDNEAADHNIQEERLTSVERSNNTLLDYDDHGRSMKTQNSSGSSAGGGLAALSATSAQGSVDSAGASSMGAGSGGAGVGAGVSGSGLAANASSSTAGVGPATTTTTAGAAPGAAAGAAAGGANASGSGYEVDEEGFSIQPAKEIAWEESQDKSGSFYSDSDSDSDNDKRRIHVKIKPLNNGQAPMSASVDELRATVENISLSPTGVFAHHSQQLQGGARGGAAASRQQSPEISNASTPTASVHPYAPLQSPTLSNNNNANNANHNRYADLGDIFSELGDMSVSAPASATLSKPPSRQIPTPTSAVGGSSIAIPRPPSRRSDMIAIGPAATSAAAAAATAGGATSLGRGRMSPAPAMNRADSIGSLEFRTAIGGMGSSRGPSPLTIGISDTIPLAVAFHEIIHAYFRGSDESRCQVKVSGDMMLSFPAGIAGLLANNPNPAKLGFRIKQVQNLESLVPNGKLVHIDRQQSSSLSTMLEFNMPALTALLRWQAENNPNASYFNVDILKYQVRTKPGASSCPFQLVSYWKCEPSYTALKVDYKYNNHAMASASPLLNVTLSVPVNGSVRNVQSKPHSSWLGESNRLVWNFTDISQNSQDGGVGTLRARLELNDGPSTPAMLATQFNCEGTTLSGIEFELQGSGYRLSLVKRRFVSGKYVCEGDGIRSGATPTPPSVGSTSPYSAKSN
ncbi:F-BAR domain only protein 2 isoform X2 [Drosophila grimshawi]|uniref:GH18204 n=1 Tax=Drosophila grimshawi TaxID=7222 RepID=B4JFU4_DROGR|nr:F-BAR domain only protein 2 isoform X2 [Drosophila grimshawi]EDV93575.1 GH18204 [Drosophila grimshawi]